MDICTACDHELPGRAKLGSNLTLKFNLRLHLIKDVLKIILYQLEDVHVHFFREAQCNSSKLILMDTP